MELNSYLKRSWTQLSAEYGEETVAFFQELVEAYSSPKRYYHTLAHIEKLLLYVDQYKKKLTFPQQIQWAIWYHDAVYNPLRKDNEEKSALLAQTRLQELGLAEESYGYVVPWILATKDHKLPPEANTFDGEFLLDIDLSILGTSRSEYEEYCSQIRKEYAMYPRVLYNRGRKKVLHHFLDREFIFKTDVCQEQWEKKAKENLRWELKRL